MQTFARRPSVIKCYGSISSSLLDEFCVSVVNLSIATWKIELKWLASAVNRPRHSAATTDCAIVIGHLSFSVELVQAN